MYKILVTTTIVPLNSNQERLCESFNNVIGFESAYDADNAVNSIQGAGIVSHREFTLYTTVVKLY